MKYLYILILALACVVLHSPGINAQQNTRNTVWVNGSSQTSHGWIDLRYDLEQRSGFDFDNLMDNNFMNIIGQGTIISAEYIDGRIGNEQNVLGVGHGFGGIALRYAQNQNSGISAMILCGVPNQGSFALDKATNQSAGGKSRAQLVVEKIEALKAGNNCQECNVTGIFKSWVDEIKAGEIFLEELSPDSDIIKDINKAENLPSVPYIVLYGVVDNFSLTRMMDTRTSLSDGDHLVQCYEARIREEKKRVSDQAVRNMIESVTGFYAGTLKFIGELVKSVANPGQIISAIGNYIGSTSSNILQSLENKEKVEAEFARILRCELANKVLEAEWLLFTNNYTYEDVEVEIHNPQLYDECLLHCDIRDAQGLLLLSECVQYCLATSTQTVIINALKIEPTDGLLKESEQKLPGANLQAEIKLPNTNHFQESLHSQAVVVEAFEDIFMGNYGAAFIVPN